MPNKSINLYQLNYCSIRPILFCLLTLFFTLPLIAQNSNSGVWDVTHHQADYQEFSFETDKSTWMNLDVSPDGESIVFDGNPLENLYDTENVIYTMINGRIYF